MSENREEVVSNTEVSPETSEIENTSAQTEETESTGPNIQEVIQQLAAQGRKLIQFTPPLSNYAQKSLHEAKTKLEALNARIIEIQKEVSQQNETIKERVQPLKDSNMLNIQADFGSADESIQQYSTLLAQIVQEVNKEHAIVSDYEKLEKETLLPVSMSEADFFDGYIKNKVNKIKKQAKKIEKDLHVSFSRYQFSFENHMKRIQNLEAFVAYNKAIREAQEKAATAKKDEAASEQ